MIDFEFWHNKWAANQIGFHLMEVNPLLMKYWPMVKPKRHDTVLLPLCGKSEDLVWLAEQHDSVQGVELSPIAVRAFFAEHLYTPLVTELSAQHTCYQFDEICLYTGDIFTAPIHPVDIIYDRAALVALPESMWNEYANRLLSLLNPGGRILLVTLDYPQNELTGPPFSVTEKAIRRLFTGLSVTQLHRDELGAQHPKRAKKGLSRFAEEVWLIER
ncbi:MULTISPECIES: thiopurine S-methyltransferase [Vibrio]|uniref:thiopurine S-methyltransferase n=1 Tax=Vibrio TaxID=662 RepID=UPI000C16A137|nr:MULTISPECIES: thiopurine S-methyltransferase [Vibrio]NNN43598.1 thiopurine S-methyltransferase [Vibrio sp. 1-1(7)]NNN71422.1 thiopurine S-methyltransferase [Vibrio sp. 12-2(3-a)]